MKNNSGNKRKFHGLIQSIKKRGRIFRMSAYTAGAIMVFLVTYMMILPAITIDKDAAAKQPGMKVSSFAESGQSAGAGTQEGQSSEIAQNSNGTAISDPTESDIPGLPDAKDSQNKGDQQNTDQKENNKDNNNEGKDSDQGQAGSDDGSSSDAVDRDNSQNEEDKSTKDQTDHKNQDSDSSDADKQSNDSQETPDPDSYTMITSPTTLIYEGEDYTVSAYVDEFCMLPEGVSLQVKEIRKDVKKEKKRYQGYYDKALEEINRIDGNEEGIDQESFSFARFFDISFVKDGQAIEPASPVDISINLDQSKNRKALEGADAASLKDKEKIRVVHFDETGKETQAEEVFNDSIKNTKKKNIDIQFAGESFSVYGVVYTVDFHWEADGKEYDFSMPGGGYMSFYQLVKELKIRTDDASTEKDEIQELIDGVASISFSDPDLVSISEAGKDTTVGAIKHRLNLECEYSAELTKEDIKEINAQKVKAGDWALISLKAFDTEEDLTVTMKNGDEWTVKVTDAQISTMFLSDSGKLYEVTVIYNEKAKIPEGSTLRVTEFSEDDSEYDYARKSVLADKKARGEQVDLNSFNLAALDISILDPKGKEIEPASTVRVDIRIKALPGVEDLEEIKESLEIQHHVEVKDGVVVETVFDGSSDASFRLNTDQAVASEGKAVDPGSVSEKDFTSPEKDGQDPGQGDDKIDVTFQTPVFSTFTVTWYTTGWGGWINTNNALIHYVDEAGNELDVSNGQPVNDTASMTYYYQSGWTDEYPYNYLIYDVDGYEYAYTYRNNDTNANRITPVLTYRNNRWKYTSGKDTVGVYNSWENLSSNDNIYVVYKKKDNVSQGGTPVPKISGEKPGSPTITKDSVVNGDGTNTLSLSVTGHTSVMEAEKLADVIVVFDVSGSMSEGMDGRSNPGSGKRRMDYAQSATKALATSLLGKNTTEHPDLIRMSLLSFSNTAEKSLDFTTDLTTFNSAVTNLPSPNGGTNWEYALQLANEMAVENDRATFVIFVTDGNPTFRQTRGVLNNGGNGNLGDNDVTDYYFAYNVYGHGDSDDHGRNYAAALTQAQSIVSHNKNFYTIGISNDVTNLTKLTKEAGAGEDHSKTATSNDELVEAFNEIAASIIAHLGYSDVRITDGITELTQTVQKSSLVSFAEDDFVYSKERLATQEEISDSTKVPEGAAIVNREGAYYVVWNNWNPTSEDCAEAEYKNGAVVWNMGGTFMLEDGYTYQVHFKVWPSQEAYDLLAGLNNGIYQMDDENKVIKDSSGNIIYDSAYYNQISGSGENYTLKTNSETSYTYREASKSGDTVTPTGEPSEPGSFPDVDPLELTTKPLKVKKQWHNNYVDSRTLTDNITLELYGVDSDGTTSHDFKTITLNKDDGWYAENNYISYGLVTYDTTTNAGAKVYETGHDFTLRETDDEAHYYELTAGVYRPMFINGTPTILEKVDVAPAGMSNSVFHYSDGSHHYYRLDEKIYRDTQSDILMIATNSHRSYMDLNKVVVDESGATVVDDTEFEYKITFTVPEGIDNYDDVEKYIWFSVYDTVARRTLAPSEYTSTGVITPVQENAELYSDPQYDNYLVATSDQEMTIKIKQGWNVRFLNLPNGTTYSFKETNIKDGYNFVKAEVSGTRWIADMVNGTDQGQPETMTGLPSNTSANNDNTVISGTIDYANARYGTTYTNKALTQHVNILKTSQDGVTPLPGAVFSLYTESGYAADPKQGAKTDLTSDGNGKIDLGKLAYGKYYLVETSAPDGYNLLAKPVEITVDASGVHYNQSDNSLSQSNDGVIQQNEADPYTLIVTNNPGVELPSTGGPGTRLYTILGSILIFGAGVLLWRRRRTI